MSEAVSRGPDWHGALAYALTGEWLDLPPAPEGGPDLDRLLDDLAACGWSGERLVVAATVRRSLPSEVLRALGPARFVAVASALRRQVLAGTVEVQRVRDRAPDPDERRLLTDRPPHWG